MTTSLFHHLSILLIERRDEATLDEEKVLELGAFNGRHMSMENTERGVFWAMGHVHKTMHVYVLLRC